MTEIPENLKEAMEQFARVHQAMETNLKIIARRKEFDVAREAMNIASAALLEAEEPLQKQIDELEEYIRAQVLELGFSTSHAGVEAKHRKGYERTTWNNKEMTKLCMSNPALLELLAPARKVSEVSPSVTINYTPESEPAEEPAEAPF